MGLSTSGQQARIQRLTILNNLKANLFFGIRVHASKNVRRASIYILIVIIVVAGVQLVVTSKLGPSFTGYVVVSSSMMPTLQTGDFVIAQSVPFSDIQVGDLITFFQPLPGGGCSGFIVVHRVVATTPQGLITQGDDRQSNPIPDEPSQWPPVTANCVRGKVVLVIPYLGSVFLSIPPTYGYLLVGLALLLILASALWLGRKGTRSPNEDA